MPLEFSCCGNHVIIDSLKLGMGVGIRQRVRKPKTLEKAHLAPERKRGRRKKEIVLP